MPSLRGASPRHIPRTAAGVEVWTSPSALKSDRIASHDRPEATSRVRLTRRFARSISLATSGFEPGLCSSGPHGSTTAIKAAD
eukprot:2960005-Prymnesium_polylepis.1